jgi:MoaA/NifB/PqqE/SkfB family radical SAM enzyme
MLSSSLISKSRAMLGILHGSRSFGGPVMGCISLTTRCNIRCIHCYFHSPEASLPSFPNVRAARMGIQNPPSENELKRYECLDLDARAIRTLIEQLLSMGTRRFQLSGYGEPFLHPEIMDFIGRIKHTNSYCLTNTNGTLLNKEVMARLIRYGFDELRVTTMAGSADVYIRTHPGSSRRTFDELKANLLHLAELKASLKKSKPKLNLVCIVIAQNAQGLREFADFAREVRSEVITFRPLNDFRDPGLETLLPTAEEAALLRQELRELKRELDARKTAHNIDNFLMTFSKRLNTMPLYRVIPCYQGWISTYINPTGEVFPCCGSVNPLGNILGQDFASIWNGPRYLAFRNQALTLPRRGSTVEGCDCFRCAHHTLNLNVYKMLHPVRGRSNSFSRIASIASSQEE